MNLREYQKQVINNVRAALRQGKNRVMIQLPTGGGKTLVFSKIARMVADRGDKVLLVTNRKELHKQGGCAFGRQGVRYSELTPKTKFPPGAQVVVAMAETLKRRLKRDDYADFVSRFKLVIFDEAHLQAFNRIFEVIDSSQYVIGMSATPIRIGKARSLDEYYDALVTGPSIAELVNQGYLCPVVNYSTPVDLSGVGVKNGDYDESDMAKVYSESKLFDGVLENWSKYASGKRTIVFCAGVENSMRLRDMYRDSGVSAAHIDANTPAKERDSIFAAFERGEITVLCNVGIATLGYDCPPIECVVLYRATMSVALYLQMCGRGSRCYPGKKYFTVLDFGTNFHRLGSWDQDRIWSLKKKRKSKKEQEAPTKVCPSCEALVGSHVMTCPKCGYVFEKNERDVVFAMLEQMTPSEIQNYAETAPIRELETIRQIRGYKAGWVLHKLKNVSDFVEYEKLRGYAKGWALIQANSFLGTTMTWEDIYK